MAHAAATPTASRRATFAVQRGFRLAALIWAPAWLLNIAAAFAGHTRVSHAPALAFGLICCATLAWALLLTSRLSPVWFIAVLGAGAAAHIAVINVQHLNGNYLYLTGLLNSVVVLAGLLLAARAARLTALAIVFSAMVWLTFHAVSSHEIAALWKQLVIAGYYAIVDVMVVSCATTMLRRAADNADEHSARTDALLSQQLRRRGIAAEHQRITALLHDTLINTLGAIRRGLPESAREQIRQRCRLDLERITDFAHAAMPSGFVTSAMLATHARATADALGLGADITDLADTQVPADTASAVLGATTELLLNVSKHAGDTRSRVTFTTEPTAKELVVTVSDFGPGWDGTTNLRGFTTSVANRVASVGGSHRVASPAPVGTVVTLRVPLTMPVTSASPHAPSLAELMPAALRRLTLLCAAWWVSLGSVQTVLAWHLPAFSGSLTAMAVLIATIAAATHWSRRHGGLSALATWALALPLAAVTGLPQHGIPGCAMTEPGAWGPDGAVGIVMAMVLLGRARQPLWAASAGLTVGLFAPSLLTHSQSADCVGATATTLVIELGTVAAIHLFRSKAESLIEQFQRDAEVRRAAENAAATTEYRNRVFTERLDVMSGPTSHLLSSIANGTADPSSDHVRAAAGNLEHALRSVVTLGPDVGAVGDLLTANIMKAAARGVNVRVMFADRIDSLPNDVAADVEPVISNVFDSLGESQTVNVSISNLGNCVTLSLVIPQDASLRIPQPSPPQDGGVQVTHELLDQEFLLTATWKVT